MLMGIRRRGERGKACLKVLMDASASLTSRTPSAIGAPSAEHAVALAGIAGAAWAVRSVISHGTPSLDVTPDSSFLAWLAQRSAAWGGQFAPALMAASDGEMRALLHEGAVAELEAGVQAGRPADADWLVQPAYRIDHAAVFLAELNASARPCPPAVHHRRAESLDQELAITSPVQSAHISAHAFAVHELTGIYGPDSSSVRKTMLWLVATHPPHERATLQASKVAALLSDALGPRARMALLDQIIIALGPNGGDASARMALARDSALVLLLLDADAEREPPVESAATAHGADTDGSDAVAEIVREAERATVAAVTERQTRYQRAVDAGSLPDALEVVRDAAADDDHEQAWSLLQDIARRHPDADPGDLVSVAPDVLGPVDLDSDEVFDGPGAGCFTVLSPAPAKAAAAVARVAPRLLNVDDRGVVWSDRGAQVMLDTKGAMSAAMGRTMIAIITGALVDDRVPALVAGWIAAPDPQMTPWDPET
jgi:hypothetical protein